MGSDGVDAGKTLGGNLLGGLALSDGPDDFRLRLCQDIVGFFLFLLLGDDGFECPLTEAAGVAIDSLESLANLTHRTIFEHHAELIIIDIE